MTTLPRLLLIAATCVVASDAAGGESADARAFVDAHNKVRSAVVQPAGYKGTWAPLPPLAWSEEVASSAQEWADHLREDNKCKLVHSDTRYGENLAMGKKLEIAYAVNMWASEGKNYRYAPVYDWDMKTGHYTQVIWRKTTHVGCGIARCGKDTVVVCRYSPAGNRIGAAPY